MSDAIYRVWYFRNGAPAATTKYAYADQAIQAAPRFADVHDYEYAIIRDGTDSVLTRSAFAPSDLASAFGNEAPEHWFRWWCESVFYPR